MNDDYEDYSKLLLDKKGKVKLQPAAYFQSLDQSSLRYFLVKHGRHTLVTTELIDFLKTVIQGRSVIEVAAGHGDIAYHLGCKATDLQADVSAEDALNAFLTGQSRINYPKDVEKLEALDAVKKYKPQVVISSYSLPIGDLSKRPYRCHATGIKEKKLFEMVETYIYIGNIETDSDKPLCMTKYEDIRCSWILSRSKKRNTNQIYIWNKEG